MSVLLDADLPKTATRKQSVIFSPRKEEAHSMLNPARLLASRGVVEKSLGLEDVSKSTASNSPPRTVFQVDAIPAALTPRPPAPTAPVFSPINVRAMPKSPRIPKKMTESLTADSDHQSTDPHPTVAGMDMRMRMKRRVADFDVGSFDMSFLPEELRKIHELDVHEQHAEIFAAVATPILAAKEVLHAEKVKNLEVDVHEQNGFFAAVATPISVAVKPLYVSHAEQVNKLEDRVVETMNQSQFDKNMYNRMVQTTSSNSSLRFTFPHSSPAQIFISTQPSIKLGQSTNLPQKMKQRAPPLNSMSGGGHPLPVIYADHSAELKSSSSNPALHQASPRQRGAFILQDHAFVVKDVPKSNPRTPARRNIQAPILFNQIGPHSQMSSAHDSRAAAAALTALTTKPLQAPQSSAEHQHLHIMCNNRIPDFFLAAMHRR